MAAQFGPPEVVKKKRLALKKTGQKINGSEKKTGQKINGSEKSRPKKTK